MKLYGIVGAGGFGREVFQLSKIQLNTSYSDSDYELVFVTENTSDSSIYGHRVLSVEEFLLHTAKCKHFNIAIAQPQIKKRIALLMMQNGIQPFSIYAPNIVDLGESTIDIGAILCHFTLISVNAQIGKFFHANIYSYVAHDCVIGDYVTFAPKVQCNGGVIIEDEVYIGSGAMIKQSLPNKPIIIGKGAVIGMGAVVTKSVMPYQTVIGNPAKVLVTANTVKS